MNKKNSIKTGNKKSIDIINLQTKLILPVVIFTFILTILATSTQGYELVSKTNLIMINGPDDYPQTGDNITIDIISARVLDNYLTITTPTKIYRYTGGLDKTLQFILTERGSYQFELINRQTLQSTEALQFTTDQPNQIIVKSESNEELNSDEKTQRLIYTDKQSYIIEETVIASALIPENKISEYKISYEFGGQVQRYNGDPQLITFSPKQAGLHYLIIRDANGVEIERLTITVYENKEIQTSSNLNTHLQNNTTGISSNLNLTSSINTSNNTSSSPNPIEINYTGNNTLNLSLNNQSSINLNHTEDISSNLTNSSNNNNNTQNNNSITIQDQLINKPTNNSNSTSFNQQLQNIRRQSKDSIKNRDRTPEEKTLGKALRLRNFNGTMQDSNVRIIKKNPRVEGFVARLQGLPNRDTIDVSIDMRSSGFVEEVVLNNLQMNSTDRIDLGIEEIPKNKIALGNNILQKAYGVDPTKINFTNGTITSIAKGRELWKCAEWEFSTQTCRGTWQKIKDIIPGLEYSIEISPLDPGFAETGLSTINTDKPTYKINQTAKIMAVVLNQEGFLVPLANVTITVTDPNNIQTIFSTDSKSITQEDDGIYTVYFTSTQLEGQYIMAVSAYLNISDSFVNSTMLSEFQVLQNYDFDIIRRMPITIDPWKGPFNASIDILPLNQNITTYNVTETLPSEVSILAATGGAITNLDNTTLIKWSYLSQNSTLNYTAQAPLISPSLLTIGKILIEYVIDGVVNFFEEARNWFIAVDPAVTRDQGIVVYADGTAGVPKKRNWTGSLLQAEESSTMAYGNAIRWQKVRCLQDYEQCLLVSQDTGGGGVGNEDLNFAVFFTSNYTWSSSTTLTGDMDGTQQNFDIECEDNSGRCMIAYENRTTNEETFTYRIWNGSSLSTEISVSVTGATNDQFNWVALYPRKATNMIGVAVQNDEGGNAGTPNIYAAVWNGSTFINWTTITTTASTANNVRTHRRDFDCAWDGSGRFTCAFGTEGQSWVNFTRYDATTTQWTALGSIYNGTGTEVIQVALCGQKPWHQFNHTYLGLLVCDNAEDLDGGIWNGTIFSKNTSVNHPTQNTNAECDTNKPDDTMNQNFECEWENSGDQVMFVWVNSGLDYVDSATYTKSTNSFSTTNWSGGTQIVSDGAADIRASYLVSNSETDNIFITYSDGTNDAGCAIWSGTSWDATGCNNTQVFETAGPADQVRWNVFDFFRTPPPQPEIEILEPNSSQRIATFSGITNPSSTSKAYSGSTTALPPASAAAPILGTEFSSNGYVNISTSNNQRTSSLVTTGGGLRAYQSFNFSITESVVSMKSLTITHEGYATSAVAQNDDTFYMYVYNWNTDSYDLLRTIFPSPNDVTTEETITSGFSDYVRYQTLIILMEGGFATGGGASARAELFTDYIGVTVENYPLRSQTIRVNATAIDDDGVALCEWSLYNGTALVKNLTAMNYLGSNQFFNISSISTITDGLYNVTVFCNDTLTSRTNTSAPVFIDNTPPAINLFTLNNNSNVTNSYALFAWNVTDFAFQNMLCNLTIDNSISASNLLSVHGENTTRNVTGLSDGFHYWNVTCADNAGNRNTSENRVFDLDTRAPSVVQTSPAHGSFTNANPVNLNFTATDVHTIINCTLRLDGTINGTLTNITNSTNYNFSFINIAETVHWWNVTCIDSFGYSNTSSNRNFTSDRTIPTIILNTTSGAVFNGTVPSLNFTVRDNIDRILTCNISVNDVIVDTNIAAPNNTFMNRNVSLTDGFKSWNVTCADDAGNYNTSDTRIFSVVSGPLVVLYSPTNGTISNGINTSFRYSPSDGNGINNCSLYIDGILNQTNTSVVNNANNTFVVNLLTEGNHTWQVYCYDTANTLGTSSILTIFADRTSPTITLNGPSAGAIITNTPQQLNFTYVDFISRNGTCNLTIDSSTSAGSNLIVNNNSLNSRNTTMSNGIHWWNVSCYDQAGNFNISENRNFTVNVTQAINTTVIADKTSYFEGEIAIVNITTRNDTNGLTSTNITIDYIFTNRTFSDVPWWNTSWLRRKPILLNETRGATRISKPVAINITFEYGTISSCSNELRIISDTSLTEVPFNRLAGDDVSNCYIIFNATVSGNASNENNYHVYFNNSAASAPTYPNLRQISLLYDDFEDGNLNGWTAGAGWDVSTNNPLGGGGNDHAHIDGTVTGVAINYSTAFDLTPYDSVNLTFRWEIETDWDAGEFIRLDFTNNAGSSWTTNIESVDGNVNEGVELDEIISINSTFRTNLFSLRFVATVSDTAEEGGFDIVNITAFNDIQTNITSGFGADQIWISRVTNTTAATTGFYQNNFTTTSRIYGNYSVTALSSSNSQTTRFGTGYDWFVIVADTAGPTITLIYPPNTSTLLPGNISFIYTSVDFANNVTNCSLIINGTIISTNITINESSNNSFVIENMQQGQYNWSIRCFDSLGSNTTQGNNILYLDNTPPVVIARSPNATTVQAGSVNFTFNVTDNFDSSIFCNVTMDNNSSRSATTTVANGANGSVLINASTGVHFWNVTCFDNINNTGYSATLNFTAADVPVVTLFSPSTNFTTNSTDIVLQYNLTSSAINNCTLILNSTSYQTVNASNISFTANDGQNNFSLASLSAGRYNWTVNCYDTNGFNGSASTRTFFLDNAAPNLTINSPANATTIFATTVRFNFTAIDVDNSLVCNLSINGAVNQSNFNAGASLGTGTQNLRNVTGFSIGNYSWSVTCFDDLGFSSSTLTYNFTIDSTVSITLNSPANNTFDADGNITFSYVPNSPADFNLGYCELYINGTSEQTQVALVSGNQYSFSETNLIQGRHFWYINCTDSAGIIGYSEFRNFTVDTTNPTVFAISPNATISNSSSILFNWTASDNLSPNMTCTVRVNGTTQTPTVFMLNGTFANATYSNFNDGTLFWNVTCTDASSRNSTSNNLNFTISQVPTVSLNFPLEGNRTRNSNLTFLVTPTDNSGFLQSCMLILDGLANQTNTTSSATNIQKSIYSYNIPEGRHNWTANCTDPSGNTGSATIVRNFTIDRTAPNISIFYPLEGAFSNTNNVPFAWNATDYTGVTLTCRLFFDGVQNNTVSAVSGSNFTTTLLNRTEGPHNWSVNCSDDLGNSVMSSTYNFTVNSPDLYINNSMIVINSTNPNLYDQIQIRANVTNLGGVQASNVIVEFWDGAPTTGINIGNATGTVNVSTVTLFTLNWNITPGYHTIYAIIDRNNAILELNDSNNNASINISVLWANITSPINLTILNTNNFSINFTSTDYTTNSINYTVLVDGVAQNPNGLITPGNIQNYNLTNISQGIKRLTIQVRDSLNRTKNSTHTFVIVDYTAPTPTILTSNNSWFNTSTPQINITVTDNIDTILNYTLFINGTVENISSINNASQLLILTSTRPDGLYTVILQATDDANNSRNSSSTTIYIDTTSPQITLYSPENNTNFTTSTVTFNFTATDNLASFLICNISIDGNISSGINVSNGAIRNYTAGGLSEGIHYWNVSCFDQARNTNTSENRIFNVFKAPSINLTSPSNNSISRNQTQLLLFNITDNTGIENCTLILNGLLNETKSGTVLNNGGTSNFTLNNLNGTYTWAVTCYDNTSLFVQNTSQTWRFTVDIDAPNPSFITTNNTWFRNSTPQIRFNITDNFDTLINYTIFVNGVVNATGNVTNSSLGTANLQSIIPDGIYTLIIQGTDDAGNSQNSSPITIYIDTQAPVITLDAPPSGTSFNTTAVQLNFTPTDNLAPYLICNLTLSNGQNQLNMNISNNSLQSINRTGLNSGIYYWNVSCYDIANNFNRSITFNFTINAPDLLITTANISFNETEFEESNNITIYANIYNTGGIAANNINVQFWRGNPTSGGTQIFNNITIPSIASGENYTVNITYSPIIGLNNIYIAVDPQTTLNGTITEENESNNLANNSFSVSLFQIFAGNLTGIIEIEKQSVNRTLYNWSNSDTNGSFLFVSDTEGNINFYSLQALGRNITNGTTTNDFSEVDTKLGTTNLSDSINTTYTISNSPRLTANHTIFERRIINIPIVNSTNSTVFTTGLLWDSSDGGNEYNGTQDIVFVNPVQPLGLGSRGTYDFEISVPAYLRNYNAAGSSVAFYVELK